MSQAESSAPRPANFLDPAIWKELNPALHANDEAFIRGLQLFRVEEPAVAALKTLITREGYVQLPNLDWGLDLKAMAQAVTRVEATGLNPPFAFVYDEFWLMFCKLHHVLTALLGGAYKVLPDFWVWRVDPARDGRGWTPHRDKGRRSLYPDGSPKSLTVWIPLTEATPLNGCMYLVPAHRDPTYNTERESAHEFALPDVRALPARAGDAFLWNQAVLHWGSHSSTLSAEPRISMAFEFQRADEPPYNQPLLEPLTLMDFNSRLRLIGKQVLQYQHMYALPENLKKFAEACLDVR